MAGVSRYSLAGFKALPLGASEPVDLASLRGKVLLISNRRFGPQGLTVLAFPSNQFGHQENATNEEILNSLKYVRPGNGYEPNFPVFEKCEVNGENAHPLFKFLKESLPVPHDDPVSLMNDPKSIIWSPVCRSDIAWNFEKFLIGRDGVPFKRYSRRFETIKMQDDIEKLLQQTV
ncbi:putative Glutathione peroxidase protein [Naja naja]|nr:putative Glutathione peroxidase protein [Naja naja]